MSQTLGQSLPNTYADMNDTIVLNPQRYGSGPRVKRIKTEQPKIGSEATFRVHYDYQSPGGRSGFGRANGETNGHRRNSAVKFGKGDAVNVENAPAAQTSPTGGLSTPARTSTLRARTSNHSEFENKFQKTYATSSSVNFSAAPIDPVEFVWWIAQQITHFHAGGEPLSGLDMSRPSPISATTPTGLPSMGIRYLDPTLEKERLREENRERKKRWRESNAERNKDNDLRCRVTKLAKAKFGVDDSSAKAAFIEKEFYTRRSKREQKQRNRATQSRTLPNFTNPSGATKLQSDLRSSLKRAQRCGVEKAGNRLIDILLKGIESNQITDDVIQEARALRNDLVKGLASAEELSEAMQLLAGNDELRKALIAGLNDEKEEEEHEVSSGEEEDQQSSVPVAQSLPDSAVSSNSETEERSHGHARNLNEATRLLIDMADTKTYASPYRNPPPTLPLSNGVKAMRSETQEPTEFTQHVVTADLMDTCTIDALLALANGGSITDDEDDKTIADPDEGDDFEFVFTTPGADVDVTKVLQHVANTIVTERLREEPSTRGSDLQLPFSADPFSSHPIREQAARLRDLFTHSGVSVNVKVPLAQASAMSQFYANLSGRAAPHPLTAPSSNENGECISPVQKNDTTNDHTPGEHLQNPVLDVIQSAVGSRPIVPSGSRQSPVGRSEDEQKKIKSYGFPPLPGSKVRAFAR